MFVTPGGIVSVGEQIEGLPESAYHGQSCQNHAIGRQLRRRSCRREKSERMQIQLDHSGPFPGRRYRWYARVRRSYTADDVQITLTIDEDHARKLCRRRRQRKDHRRVELKQEA